MSELPPLDQAKQQALWVFSTVCEFLKELHVPGWLRAPISALPAIVVYIGGVLYAFAIALIINTAVPLAQAVLDLISKARRDLAPQLNGLMGSALSEMLGTEISGDDLPAPEKGGVDAKRAAAIGAKVHATLEKEFAPDGKVTPESGQQGAKAFTGYVVNFAVVNTFISIIAELLSNDHLEEWRELGVEIAQNLGLGRLSRDALRPLINNTIAKPYDRHLKAKYTPEDLNEAQIVHALNHGTMTPQEADSALAERGFEKKLRDELIVQLTPHLTDAELQSLIRFTDTGARRALTTDLPGRLSLDQIEKMTVEKAVAILKNQGVPGDTALQKLVIQDLARADAHLGAYLSYVEGLALDGYITIEQARAIYSELPIGAEEFRAVMRNIAIKLEYPRKKLTLAQVQQGFVDGIIDLSYWDRFLDAEGYSEEDQLILLYELLIRIEKDLDKKKAADDRAKRKAAAPKK